MVANAARSAPAAVAFVLIATIFGAIFAWVAPPFWGHDEITQFGRAYQVSRGGILPHEIEDPRGVAYGGTVPASVDYLMDYALRDYTTNPEDPAPRVGDSGRYAEFENQAVTADHHTIWFTNTAAYSPVPYLPAAFGIRFAQLLNFDVGHLLLTTRLAGLAVYVAIVGAALVALRDRRAQWLVFAVALLPIAVFQAGTITADTVTNAVAILASALLLKSLFLGDPLNRLERAALLTTAVVLPICKPTYVLVALLVVLVPPEKLGLSGRTRWLPWICAGTGALVFLIWTKISSPTTAGMGLMRKPAEWNSVRPGEQLRGVLTDPIGFLDVVGNTIVLRDHEWFTEFFGELGFAYTNVPATSILAAMLALAVAAGTTERFSSTSRRTGLVAAGVAATVALIYGTLYLSFTPVDYFIIDGVQGRYFVPIAILFFAVVLRWISLRLTDISGETPRRGPAVTIVVATVVSLVFAVWKYAVVLYG